MQLNNKPLKLIPLVLILVLVASIIPPGVAKADPGWYDSDWDYRKKITINSANVSGSSNLLYFPVSIQVTDTDLASDALDNGYDILFTAGDETTKLQHEIESFNGTTGNLIAWVEIPSLSHSDDTEIYMYYGNSGVTGSSENVTGVWDGADYKMVQHLEENSGGASAITDSTSYDNDGSDDNTLTYGATGQMDGAIGFNGSDDYIQVDDSTSLDITSNITLEAWVKTTDNTLAYQIILEKRPGTEQYNYYMRLDTGRLRFAFNHNNTSTGHINITADTTSVNSNTWHYVVATYDKLNMRLYVDGTQIKSQAQTNTMLANAGAMIIGKESYDNQKFFNGTIDEVRVSATARSADWIKTSYNNQSNPGDFLDFGPEIGVPTVTTTGAGPVEETSATVNGTLTVDGGEGNQYRFEYDFDAPGWPYDYNTPWSTENKTSGENFSAALSGLDEGTVYYYRAQARNNAGTSSGGELNFLTKPLEPTGFTATTASSSQINLSWTKGVGAVRTWVQGKQGSYPTSRTDGYQVYFGTDTSASDTGLLPSKDYYYSAWSEVTGSTQYSDAPAQANATTSSGQPTVIGGLVLPINKAAVLAPWLFLGAVLSLVIVRIILYVRKRRNSVHRY